MDRVRDQESELSVKAFMAFGLRAYLGAVFAFAGFMKLMEPAANIKNLFAQYSMLPDGLIPLLVVAIPWLEWILGAFLIAGYMHRASIGMVTIASGTMFVFLGISHLFGTVPVDCGCFGTQGIPVATWKIMIVDGVNFLIGVWLWRNHDIRYTIDRLFLTLESSTEEDLLEALSAPVESEGNGSLNS